MKPKVSIIMPVYNAEKTLKRAIDSILSQTFTSWELIMIDDGSTDNSSDICEEYAERDNRIKVIHRVNGGVASARQEGLDLSSGEYVIHADSDDWMKDNALNCLYSTAISEDADVVICDYYLDNNASLIYVKQEPTSKSDNKQLLKDFSQKLIGSLWNKLIRRDIIVKYNIRFVDGVNYSEDLLFCYQLFVNPIRFVYLPKAFYHYVMQESSITHIYSRKNIETRLKAYNHLKMTLDCQFFHENIQAFMFYIIIDAIRSKQFHSNEILQMYKECSLKVSLKHSRGIRKKLVSIMLSLGWADYAIQLFNYRKNQYC